MYSSDKMVINFVFIIVSSPIIRHHTTFCFFHSGQKPGGVATLKRGNRHIYYLVSGVMVLSAQHGRVDRARQYCT